MLTKSHRLTHKHTLTSRNKRHTTATPAQTAPPGTGLIIAMTECVAHVAADVLCTQHGILHRLTRKHRGIARYVDGDKRNTPLHILHHYTQAYTFAGIAGKLRSTAELADGASAWSRAWTAAWRGMITFMTAVALLAALASPAARAQTDIHRATLGAIQDNTPNTPVRVDDVLTAGEVSHPRLTVITSARQWQRCADENCSSATDIISSHDTAATYTVQTADRDHWLRLRVAYGGESNGTLGTLFSNIVRVDRRGMLGTITGNAKVGGTLTAGAVTDADASPNTDVGTITYEWQTSPALTGPFTAAPGTNNANTYTIASDSQAGSWLRVIASYPNAGGDSLMSDPVGPVTTDPVAAVLVSPTVLNVPEGDSTSYTMVLDSLPTTAVTIAVTSDNDDAVTLGSTSLTFTTVNWNIAQTVTVIGVEDANSTSETVQLTHAVSSGNADYAALMPSPVTVSVTDNDTAGVSVSDTTLAVNEGATIAYTIRLNTQPSAGVTVIWHTDDAGAATVSDGYWADGDFWFTGHPVKHPGTADFCQLGKCYLSFTEANWNIPQTVLVVTILDDDTDNETVGLRFSTRSDDPNYRLSPSVNADVTVNVFDISDMKDDMRGVTLSTTALTVNEGATATYTIRLNTQPSDGVTVTPQTDDAGAATVSPATLTFTMGDWNTAQTVTVTGVEDADANNESVTLMHTATSSDTAYNTVTIDAVAVTVNDDDTAGVSVLPTTLTFNEGDTGEYTLCLDTQPTAPVTITVAGADATEATVSPATLIFSATGDWGAAQTVTVTSVEDADVDNESFNLTHTATSSDAAYNTVTISPVAVTVVDDNEAVGVSVSSTTLAVSEADSGTYTLMLTDQPTTAVTIAVTSDNDDAVTLGSTSLTFTTVNWNIAQTVTVTGVEDANSTNETVQLTHAVSSGNADYTALMPSPVTVTVSVTDNDTAGVSVLPTTLTFNEGDTGEYTLCLDTQPTAPVTITVAGADATEATVSPATLIFSATGDWGAAQTVTVTSVEDADVDNESFNLTHTATSSDAAYNTVTISPVAVTVVDDNEAVGVSVSSTTLAVSEADSGTYTLMLTDQPTTAVTIAVTSDNDDAVTLGSTSLTFTTVNWNIAQTVTVIGVEDANSTSETVQLTHAVSSGNADYTALMPSPVTVTVSVTDNDTAGVSVLPTTLTFNEGDTGEYTLCLDTQPTAPVTITVAGADATEATVSPATLIFSATGDWGAAQTVTVTSVEDADVDNESFNLTHTATSSDAAYNTVTISPVAVTVVDDNEAVGVSVSSTTLAVNEGATIAYTIRLNTQPSAGVTVTPQTDDAGAATVSPATLTFTMGDWNTAQTVTVTGVEDADANNESVTLTHTATSSDTAYNTVTIDAVAVTVNDDETAGVSVSSTTLAVSEADSGTYTLMLTNQPTAAVTITVAVADATEATVSPTTLTFDTDDWNTVQTVTVTSLEDADMDNESVNLTHTMSSNDASYARVTPDAVLVTVTELPISLNVDNSGGAPAPDQADGLIIARYLFGMRSEVGLLQNVPGNPSFSEVTANIERAVASGRLDVDNSGGAPDQADGLMIARYLFGMRREVGLLQNIPGNPSFSEVTANIRALLR